MSTFHKGRAALVWSAPIFLMLSTATLAAPLYPTPQFVARREIYDRVLVGDFNGDSKPDLAVATGGPIWVFLGRGLGEFGPKLEVPVGGGDFNSSSAIASGDFNGDHFLDLAAANSGSNDLSIVLGNGDGTFQPETRLSTLGQQPGDVAAGDLDGNGLVDLVAANSSQLEQSISVHLRQRDGTYVSSRIVVGPSPLRVAIGDLNKDGRADIAVVGRDFAATDVNTSSYLRILLGNGNGTFVSGQLFQTAPFGDRSGVTLGDVNGDGVMDALMLSSASGFPSLAVFLGRGDGTFTQGASVSGCCNDRVAIADLNGDGKADLLGGTLQVFLGQGDGTFTALEAPFPPFGGPTALADFDGDGRLDVVMGSLNSVFFGLGDGRFALPNRYQASVSPAMIADDLNADGETDILFANGNAILVPGIGGGGLGSQIAIPSGNNTVALAVGDFNGDGRKDLAAANASPPSPFATYYEVSVLLGNGDLTFGPRVGFRVGDVPSHVAVADLNGDGRDDLIVSNQASNDISVLLGNGDGTFAQEVRYPVGSSPRFVLPGDFNADGRRDLAVANNGSQDLSILVGNGDGSFRPELRFAAGGYPIGLASGDFNADGRQDLVVSDDLPFSTGSSQPPDAVSVLIGAGDGTFGSPITVGIGDGPSVPIVADLNSDGRDDIALTYRWTYTVSIFLGTEVGGFGPEIRSGVWTLDPIGMAAADFNRDGFKDLYVASAFGAGGFVVALPNQTCVYSCDHALDLALTFGGPGKKGAGSLSWRTDREGDLAGFNVVVFDTQGNRIQQNPALIPCQGCVDLGGYNYAFQVAKHKSGRDIFVEVVHRDGHVVLFGPALRQ